MKLVNLIPLKEIDFSNQDQFDAYQKKHSLRPDTKVTIAGKVTTAGQAAKNSEPVKGTSVFGKDKGGSVFGKSAGASTKSDKSKPKEISNDDVEALTSYKDFNKFFKANSDKLNKDDVSYIEDEIGALKYLESDYKRGDADREEVEVAYVDLQDLIKKAMGNDNNDDWMNDLDSIDVSDIKGKADPNADSWTHGDVFGATFKDPQTGKPISVGDAYDREDDSPAYQKAFAYVAQFNPDDEAVMGTQAYDDLNKKAAPKANLPKKASQLDYNHASSIADVVNAQSGLDGYVDTDDNTDAIMYHGNQTGNAPTYTLYFGANDDYGKPDEFRVSLLSTYGNDPSNIDSLGIDKSFKSGDDAMKFMVAVAKKYKKELEMDDDANESIKLTSILPKNIR